MQLSGIFAGFCSVSVSSLLLGNLYDFVLKAAHNLQIHRKITNRLVGLHLVDDIAFDIEGRTVFDVPFWFYVLPIVWVLLLVELYEPHVAASGKRTTRGIAIAAFVGLLAYSVLFIIQQDSNLPRVCVGGILFFASCVALLWRMMLI